LDIIVKVKTKAQKDKVEKDLTKADWYLLSTRELPNKGKANQAVIKILAEYFNTAQSNVVIKKGARSKIKHIYIK
jgi:uncharacterized protein YggU (UPF0235/DUF167 family)